MRIAFALALALTLVPARGLADPSEGDLAEAKLLVQRAVTSSQGGEHEISAQLYQRAYKLSHDAVLLSNIAAEYELIQKSQWALTYYCEYLRADPNGPNVAFAREHIRAYAVATNTAAAPTVEEVCATIGTSQAPVVEPPPSPPPAPVRPPPAPPARPIVTAPVPPPSPEGHGMSRLRIGALALAGFGAASLGVGAYYGVKAKSIENELDEHPVGDPWPANVREREALGRTYNRRAIGLMAGGGAALAIGVTAFVLLRSSGRDDTPRSAMVAPVVTGDSIGLVTAGTF